MVRLEFREIDGRFAYEVGGVNLWDDLDEATVSALADAWSRRGVLVFRRQAISEDELVAFSRRFGDPDVIVRTDWQGYRPEIIQISNMRDYNGRAIGGLGAGELGWHTDQSYVLNPATGSILYMVEKPVEGGHTYWANLQLAYQGLPAGLRARIAGRSAIYDYVQRQSTYEDEKPMSSELRARTPPVTHPLVNTHPVTGKKSLYLDPTTTVGIAGLPEAEGKALLDELNAHATRPEFVYRHDWQIGDVVMWDNGFLLHRRDPFDPGMNRWLKRTTIRLPASRHIVPASALAA